VSAPLVGNLSPMARLGVGLVWVAASLCAPACGVPDGATDDSGATPDRWARTAGSIDGRVYDPDLGAAAGPIEGAHIVTLPHGHEATSDGLGEFTLPHLIPGTYVLQVTRPDGGTTTSDRVQVPAGPPVDVLMALPEATPTVGNLQLHVTGPAGHPVEGATVRLSTADSETFEATTDADGSATVPSLGGVSVSVEVGTEDDTLWSRHIDDVSVPEFGGVQLAVQLSGRPSADATVVGSATCLLCHGERGQSWLETAHGRAHSDRIGGGLEAHIGVATSVGLGTATIDEDIDGVYVLIEAASGEARTFSVDGFLGDAEQGGVPWTKIGDLSWPLPLASTQADPNRADGPDTSPRLVAWRPEVWLDTTGEFTFDEGDTPAVTDSADAACFSCHVSGVDVALGDEGGLQLTATPTLSDTPAEDARWVEGAVGCERCHGPGSSHVAARDGAKARAITRPDLLDRDRAADVCAQCHSRFEGAGTGLPVAWSPDAATFQPGQDLAAVVDADPLLWDAGAAAAPGQQATEWAQSAHSNPGGPACWDCHDVHGEALDAEGAPLPALLRLDHRDNALCSTCHLGLDFDADTATMAAHGQHGEPDPAGASERGRCTGCHMPATAARVAWSDLSAAGDLASHRFAALSPANTLAAFDAAGESTLLPGEFPAHACQECHARNGWRQGSAFLGEAGDPTLRATHERHLSAFGLMFP
jgi:hypothetical protein